MHGNMTRTQTIATGSIAAHAIRYAARHTKTGRETTLRLRLTQQVLRGRPVIYGMTFRDGLQIEDSHNVIIANNHIKGPMDTDAITFNRTAGNEFR